MDNKVTTIVGVEGTVALLNYFGKLNEEDSIKIILTIVCVWIEIKVLYTKGLIIYKLSLPELFDSTMYSGQKMDASALFWLKKPPSPVNMVLTTAFIPKL